MTDNEIIKALECCGINQDCKGCYFDAHESGDICAREIVKNAFDLNDQLVLEEITKLKEYINRCKSGEEYWVKCLIERPNEAVREFAEKLKESITDCHTVSDGEYVGYDWTDITHCIDNLVKEMVSDKE